MKLSIITINYNNREGLERTIQSVVGQTWKEFEYLVIDGGSNDGSKEIIEKYSGKIDYWVSEPDKGIYNAMNKGILAAKGEYLLFLNSGDEFFNHEVLKLHNIFIANYDLLLFDIQLIFKERIVNHSYPNHLSFKTFYRGAIGHPSTFIKKTLFDKYGLYNEELRIVADWQFFMNVLKGGKTTYKKYDIILSKFYMDGVSTINQEATDKERHFVFTNEFDFFYNDYIEYEKEIKSLKSKIAVLGKLEKNIYVRILKKLRLINL